MQVVFATPTLSRALCVEYVQSALATQYTVQHAGCEQIWRMQGGDPYLDKVRNQLVSDFLINFPDADCLFFIDDDMGWEPQAALRMIHRPEDVLVGIYPKKMDNTEFPCDLILDNGEFVERDGLYQVAMAPTGFMRIRRHVLEKLADDSPTYMNPGDNGQEFKCWDIFRTGFVADAEGSKTGKYWGEDYYFSARWRNMGGEIWCDPNMMFTHRGQKIWAASFEPSIKLTKEKLKRLKEDHGKSNGLQHADNS